eukprot:TRINITY_DN5649_c0_g1_i1.p1 TRINITY_DN5649_c0_g1~~TRINITY_DN5649_c0_g1_i1.p1  ORF type:complete len:377 (+),score=77.77 TRINITY_DN5649_c0_g1_i1:357-1487(+)
MAAACGRPEMPALVGKNALWVKRGPSAKQFKLHGQRYINRRYPESASRYFAIIFGTNGVFNLQRRRVSNRVAQQLSAFKRQMNGKRGGREIAQAAYDTLIQERDRRQAVNPTAEDMLELEHDIDRLVHLIERLNAQQPDSDHQRTCNDIAKSIHELDNPFGHLPQSLLPKNVARFGGYMPLGVAPQESMPLPPPTVSAVDVTPRRNPQRAVRADLTEASTVAALSPVTAHAAVRNDMERGVARSGDAAMHDLVLDLSDVNFDDQVVASHTTKFPSVMSSFESDPSTQQISGPVPLFDLGTPSSAASLSFEDLIEYIDDIDLSPPVLARPAFIPSLATHPADQAVFAFDGSSLQIEPSVGDFATLGNDVNWDAMFMP